MFCKNCTDNCLISIAYNLCSKNSLRHTFLARHGHFFTSQLSVIVLRVANYPYLAMIMDTYGGDGRMTRFNNGISEIWVLYIIIIKFARNSQRSEWNTRFESPQNIAPYIEGRGEVKVG